jgi:protein ImuB
MQSLWLYLYFPSLQLDTLLEQMRGQDVEERAYVVVDQQANRVCQLNTFAYSAGIRLGMGLASAALLHRDLQVIAYQDDVTQGRLEDIANSLYLITSDICFFKPHGLLLRVHHMLGLYGGLKAYWQVLKNQLAEQHVHYHYATGYSPLAAEMLARVGKNCISDDQSWLHQQVLNCALEDCQLDNKVTNKLSRVGIKTVADLLAISLHDLAQRFDNNLATYIGRLTASLAHPMVFYHPPEYFSRYLELLYEIENTQFLLNPLQQLFRTLETFLRTRDLITHTVQLRFYQRDHPPLECQIGSQQGEYKMAVWLSLSRLKLESLQLNSSIYALNLSTNNTQVRSPERPDFFTGKQGTVSRLQLLSLLQAKLGEQALYQPRLVDDFRPELAVQAAKLANQGNMTIPLYALRPSFLLPQPCPLQKKVRLIHGPERLNTGWWDHHPVIRDYFIARTPQGQWWWVFKSPEQHWYLHGIFS